MPVAPDAELHYAWCKLGVKDDFQLYPGDHLLTDPTAVPTVVKWIEERVAGKTAPSTCGQHEPGAKLPASARLTPETGDLIIPIPGWNLSGAVTEKKSGISLEVPKGATLSAEGDLTNEKLTASLLDSADQTDHHRAGAPGPGERFVDPDGTGERQSQPHQRRRAHRERCRLGLHEGWVDIVGLLRVPIGCTTSEPIALPLSVSEPVNQLAAAASRPKPKSPCPRSAGAACSVRS